MNELLLAKLAEELNERYKEEGLKLTADKLKAYNEKIEQICTAGATSAGFRIGQLIGEPQLKFKAYKGIARKILNYKTLLPGEDYYIPSFSGSTGGDFPSLNAYWVGEAGEVKSEKLGGTEVTVKPVGMATPNYYITLDEVMSRKYDILKFFKNQLAGAMDALEDYRLIQILAAAVPDSGSEDHTIVGASGGFLRYTDVMQAIELLLSHGTPAWIIVPTGAAMDIIQWNYKESIKNAISLNLWTDLTNENMLKSGDIIGTIAGAKIVVITGKTRVSEKDEQDILADNKVYLVAEGAGAFGQQADRNGKKRWAIGGEPFTDAHHPIPTFKFLNYQRIVECVENPYKIVEITISAS